ncbi:MAG: response regulator [Nitrospirales bacterium]|nr:response regulator [Nitrospira sp.]MDR4502540.1 response regulator [Nitrospirales bacterium]
MCQILVVDNDPAMRSLLVDELSDNGCQVVESPDGCDALAKVKLQAFNLVITDLKMPGGGYAYLKKMLASVQDCPVILITAFGNAQTRKDVLAFGISAYFDKPVRVNELRAALQRVCPIDKLRTCQNQMIKDG